MQGEPRASRETGQEFLLLCEKCNNPAVLPSGDELHEVFPAIVPGTVYSTDAERQWEKRRWEEFIHDESFPKREVLTREFIQAFGDYLGERMQKIAQEKAGAVSILELGAGDGRLHYFLQKYLEDTLGSVPNFHAVDTKQWEKDPRYKQVARSFFPVEEKDNRTALEEFQPDIVVVSWMPPWTDFTKEIRQYSSVQEYILIGHAYDNVCGLAWETYGQDSWERHEGEMPLFQKEGFSLVELPEISKNQIYHLSNDSFMSVAHPSQTISFRRD